MFVLQPPAVTRGSNLWFLTCHENICLIIIPSTTKSPASNNEQLWPVTTTCHQTTKRPSEHRRVAARSWSCCFMWAVMVASQYKCKMHLLCDIFSSLKRDVTGPTIRAWGNCLRQLILTIFMKRQQVVKSLLLHFTAGEGQRCFLNVLQQVHNNLTVLEHYDLDLGIEDCHMLFHVRQQNILGYACQNCWKASDKPFGFCFFDT